MDCFFAGIVGTSAGIGWTFAGIGWTFAGVGETFAGISGTFAGISGDNTRDFAGIGSGIMAAGFFVTCRGPELFGEFCGSFIVEAGIVGGIACFFFESGPGIGSGSNL